MTDRGEDTDRRISAELNIEYAGYPRAERVRAIHRRVGRAGDRSPDGGVKRGERFHDNGKDTPKRRKNG